MNTTGFEKAPREKQLAVINAGFRCFGENGFQKTAMREIAGAAGVSKAALFHYFGTKRDLYIFLFQFACDEIAGKIPAGTEDFMESIAVGTRAKFEVMEQYPGMYHFLISVMKDGAEEAKSLRDSSHTRAVTEGSRTLFSKVDWSKLREGVSPEEALNLVSWVSSGCLNAGLGKTKEELLAEVGRYLGLVRQAIYKEGVL